MSLTTTTFTAPLATSAAAPPARFLNTLAAEWSKLTALRSTYLTLGLGLLLSIGTSALAALAVGSSRDEWSTEVNPLSVSMLGNIWALVISAVFGALVMSREYTGGLIRVTLAATPRRDRVLAAKLLVVALVMLVFGLLATVGMFLAAQLILDGYGMPATDLGNADARRMVLALAITMPYFPLVGLAFAVLLRSSAGAITSVLGLLWMPQIVGQFLPRWWQEHLISLLPGSAVDSVTLGHVESSFSYSDPVVGALIAAVWLIAFTGAAYLTSLRRDA